jgi:AAA domain
MPKASDAPRALPAGGSSPATSGPVVEGEIVEDEFTSLDDAEEFLKALFFGTEGTGKTTAAAFMANLPGDGDVIVINAEAGFKKGALRALGVNTSRLKTWNPPGDGIMTYDKLERLYYRTSARLRENPGCVTGVIMDSGTEISNKLLEQAAMYWYTRDQNNYKKFDDDKRDSPEINEIQDYGMMTNQVRKLLRKFRDLPCHFVMTALETEGKTEGDFAAKHAAPEFSPKLRTSVLGYVDIALRFRSETVALSADDDATLVTATTKPGRLVRAKDRLGILPRNLCNPRFDRLMDFVSGEITIMDDPERTAYAKHREQADAYKMQKAAERKAKLDG